MLCVLLWLRNGRFVYIFFTLLEEGNYTISTSASEAILKHICKCVISIRYEAITQALQNKAQQNNKDGLYLLLAILTSKS